MNNPPKKIYSLIHIPFFVAKTNHNRDIIFNIRDNLIFAYPLIIAAALIRGLH